MSCTRFNLAPRAILQFEARGYPGNEIAHAHSCLDIAFPLRMCDSGKGELWSREMARAFPRAIVLLKFKFLRMSWLTEGGVGNFNGAETNCRIAHIQIFAVCHL